MNMSSVSFMALSYIALLCNTLTCRGPGFSVDLLILSNCGLKRSNRDGYEFVSLLIGLGTLARCRGRYCACVYTFNALVGVVGTMSDSQAGVPRCFCYNY